MLSVAQIIDGESAFLGNFAEAAKRNPLGEPDPWIKLPEGCTP